MAERRRDCGGEGGAEDAAFYFEALTELSAAVWISMLDSHDATVVCVSSVSIAMSVICWSCRGEWRKFQLQLLW